MSVRGQCRCGCWAFFHKPERFEDTDPCRKCGHCGFFEPIGGDLKHEPQSPGHTVWEDIRLSELIEIGRVVRIRNE